MHPTFASLNLSGQIFQARTAAARVLNRLNRSTHLVTKEAYLIKDELMVGIRFCLGVFNVRWDFEDASLQVYRERQLVQTVSMGNSESKRAA